jgi:plastocyanin
MDTKTLRSRIALAAACLLALGLTACGDDDDTATDDATTDDTTETDGDGDGETVEVTAVDYAFEDLPDSVAAGTTLSLTNGGTEPHELVAVRIPDEETRPVSEIVALPEEELGAVFGGEPEPALVILAATGTTDTPGVVVGDGTLTETGRYAIVCFLPVGSDDSILDPEADGPPESDSPPHVTQGMFAELTVT